MFTTTGKLKIGDSTPMVAAPDQDGEMLQFSAYCSKGFAFVFFFPKADTPGCAAQVCSLRDAFEDLSQLGVRIVGVSLDSIATQKRFHRNRKLPYPLVADSQKRVTRAFGVPSLLGLAKRQAFLFKNGVLIWKDTSASTEQQASDVLRVVRES